MKHKQRQMGKRDKEKPKRKGDRQTDTDRDRQTETDRQRQTETERGRRERERCFDCFFTFPFLREQILKDKHISLTVAMPCIGITDIVINQTG